MRYYKKPDNTVHAFEDNGSQDHLITEDMEQLTQEQLAALLAPPAPTPEQVRAGFVAALQQRLDVFAQTRNYDGILSACTYATSTVPGFAAEGQYCVQARDATWLAGYALLAEVAAGSRPVPTLEEVLAEMPVLEWPAP